MADNVDITSGTGTTVATDDVDGVQFQRQKLTLGADGVDDGDVSAANPLPVYLADPAGDTTLVPEITRFNPMPDACASVVREVYGPSQTALLKDIRDLLKALLAKS